MPTTFIFVHIEKTAGRSVNQLLDTRFGKDKVVHVYPPPMGDEFFDATLKLCQTTPLIVGHLDFGIHRIFGITSFSYFTFLRNPIDRLVSEYFYFKKRNAVVPENAWRKKNRMIAECNRPHDFAVHPDRVYNPMASRICGKMFMEEVSLARAMRLVVEHFAFVGVTEKMDLSMKAMEAALGGPLGPLPHVNRTDYSLLSATEQRELEDALSQTDAIDVKLYAWCNDRLEGHRSTAGRPGDAVKPGGADQSACQDP